MKPIRFAILFEPRDLWVGVFWDTQYMWNHYDYEKPKKEFMISLRVYITIIPMLPLRISIDVQRVKAYLSRLLTKREPDGGKSGVLSLPDVVKSESNLPA